MSKPTSIENYFDGKICSECKVEPARHYRLTGWEESTILCCKCYIKRGGAPADWHEGCMKADEEAKRSKA